MTMRTFRVADDVSDDVIGFALAGQPCDHPCAVLARGFDNPVRLIALTYLGYVTAFSGDGCHNLL